MQTTFMTKASITIPADSYETVKELVLQLGGTIIDDEIVTVPPMLEIERPGRMLKGLRLREGLTQKEVSNAIGVPVSHVSAYENDKRPIPADKADMLAKLLNSVSSSFISRSE